MTAFVTATTSTLKANKVALELAELLVLDQPTGKGRTRDRVRAVAQEVGTSEAQSMFDCLFLMLGYDC